VRLLLRQDESTIVCKKHVGQRGHFHETRTSTEKFQGRGSCRTHLKRRLDRKWYLLRGRFVKTLETLRCNLLQGAKDPNGFWMQRLLTKPKSSDFRRIYLLDLMIVRQ
jgi:hypothetical protein